MLSPESIRREIKTSSRNKTSIQTVKIIHSTFIHHYPLISDHRKASIEQIEISSVTSSHQNIKSSRVTTQEPIDRTAINERIVRRGNRAGEKNVREVIFFRKLSRRSLKIQSFSESNLKKDNQSSGRASMKASSHLQKEREKFWSPLIFFF